MANFLKSLFVKGVEIDTAGAITGDVLKYNGTKFGAASAGGGSVVGVLDDLTDVAINAGTLATGDVVRYNSSTGLWENSQVVGPAGPQGEPGANGANGTEGSNGMNGANGTNGADGGGNGLPYLFNTSTTLTPANGQIRFDASDFSSVTSIAISDTSAYPQPWPYGFQDFISSWQPNGYIIISNQAKQVVVFRQDSAGTLSASNTYFTFTVTPLNANLDLFTNGEDLTVSYVPQGISASTNQVVYRDSSNNLVGSANLTYDTSTGLALEGDLRVDGIGISSTTFVVDSTNNRVGIGTSAPDEVLDVDGNIALTGNIIFEGTTANNFETTLSVTDPTADRTITLPDASGTVALITVSDTAPASPTAGNMWFKSDTGNLLVYYDSYWIDAAAPAYSTLDGGTA